MMEIRQIRVGRQEFGVENIFIILDIQSLIFQGERAVQSMNTSTPLYKIVVLGEGRVGKTSMTLKYTRNQFNDDQPSSINACYLEKQLKLPNYDNKTVKLAIWDTAGQQLYNAVAPVYYRDAVGAVIVYEIVSSESFEKVKKWVTELKDHANNKDIIIVIAGNKCDMETHRRVDKQQAQSFAKACGARHYLVSAKSGANINDLFRDLSEQIYEVKKNKDKMLIGGKGKNPRIRIEQAPKQPESKDKKKPCC